MNRKQFAVLLIVLILLGAAVWLVQQRGKNFGSMGGTNAGRKLMGETFPLNDVAHIVIRAGTNELNLINTNDLWRVRERAGYPANFSSISEVLIKLGDLKIVQSEEVGPAYLPRLELAPPGSGTNSGTVVDFRDKNEKTIAGLVLGKKHLARPSAQQKQFGMMEGFPDGRYVLRAGDASHALLIADALTSLEPKPEEWLNKDFFKVERPKSVAVDFPNATNSWKIVRDTDSGEWKLENLKADEKPDAARISAVNNPFASASFDDVELSGATAGGTNAAKPTMITIETFDDFRFSITVGEKTGQDYPLTLFVTANFPKKRIPARDEKPEDKSKAEQAWAARQKELDEKLKQTKRFEGWTYLVPTWTVDPIVKERKDLLEEKKEEVKPGSATETNLDTNVPGPLK